MENASKALLISASILIAIILIAFAVKTISSTQGTQEAVESTMTAAEITMFNSKFIKYCGNNKSPAEARALVNEIIAYNASVNYDDNKRISVLISINGTTKYNDNSAPPTNKTQIINIVTQITKNVKIEVAPTVSGGMRANGTIRRIYIQEI